MSIYIHFHANAMPLTPASTTTASSITTKPGSEASLINTTISEERSKHVAFQTVRSIQTVAIIPYAETFNQVYRKTRRERFAGKIRRFLEVLHLKKPKIETNREAARREYKDQGNDDEYYGAELKWKLQPCEHADGKYIKFGCCEHWEEGLEEVNWRRSKVYNNRG